MQKLCQHQNDESALNKPFFLHWYVQLFSYHENYCMLFLSSPYFSNL
ncbi:hypothetical protein B4113_1584 [Geobacillus sp. B4113_201601]|nr:hypothetical protein B4113_1584 [Geobacillus sp. B4113_201601]